MRAAPGDVLESQTSGPGRAGKARPQHPSLEVAVRSPLIIAVLALLPLIAVHDAGAHPCPVVTDTLGAAVDVTTWPPAPFRWKDVGANTYAQTYKDSYLYADADVTVSYAPCQGLTFAGHLSAAGLKPNFAYQIKIVGKPTGLFGDDGDDLANEMIGYTGRWWRTQPNPGNSSDADYEANHENPDYIFEGYLLFDFFITDRFGAAEVDFALDSSYHVLWWTHQRTAGACDSPPKWRTVTGAATDAAYDVDLVATDIGVFAEIERLCTGTTTMPLGLYGCRLLLTEESFHQSGEDEGYWASAMGCDDLSFEIVDSLVDVPRAPPAVVLHGNCPNPFNPATVIAFTLAGDRRVRLGVHALDGGLVATLLDGRLEAGRHEVPWRGRDARGRTVPSGVYLYRLESGGVSRSGLMTLLK